MENNFKKELKALLEKYNAIIYLDYADCSDTHGMYEVNMVAKIGKNKIQLNSDGYCVDSNDIRLEEI